MSPKFERYFNLIASSLAIISFLISLLVLPDEHKYIGYATSAGLGIFAIFTLGFYAGRRATGFFVTNDSEKHFIENLILYFKKKREQNANEEIIRLGTALSTPLWLSQNYTARKIIGQFVYDAAIDADNYQAQVKTLIDDLGWTNVELGLFDEAESKILLGIKIAKDTDNGYYLSKGYRHLFGINYRSGNLVDAENYLNLAIESTEKLPADKKKDELIAEIHFAKSSLEYKKGNLGISLREIDTATEQYKKIPDKEWAIKILARKGDILLKRREIEEALNVYKHGLHEARKFHFNKQIVANMIGVGKCQFENGDYVESKATLDNAFLIAERVGMFYEKSLITIELEKLKTKIQN